MARHKNSIAVQANILRRLAKRTGIRKTARLAGLTPMRVSRFVNAAGASDVATWYAVALALGCRIELVTPS